MKKEKANQARKSAGETEIKLPASIVEKLQRLAGVTGWTAQSRCEDILNNYLDDVLNGRRIGELEIQSFRFDSLEEAKRVTAAANAYDRHPTREWSFSEEHDGVYVEIVYPEWKEAA